jgi:hypothetical protein
MNFALIISRDNFQNMEMDTCEVQDTNTDVVATNINSLNEHNTKKAKRVKRQDFEDKDVIPLAGSGK